MDRTLVLASTNQNKLKEISQILQDIPYNLKSLNEINFKGKIGETGRSFQENARLKAEIVGKKTGLLTLAEDSGLEVDYLSGRPGIRSARYTSGTDQDRINKVLEELQGVAKEKRTARFLCIAAVYNPKTGNTEIFEGESRGLITVKPCGNNGFGYDPIFYNLDLKKTNAQASPPEKNRVSHRARAFQKVKKYLLCGLNF